MSNTSLFGENLKVFEELATKYKNYEYPKMATTINSAFKLPKYKNELIELTKEQNNSLETLVEYNKDISEYNRELVSLNKMILNKINSLNNTLTFLNEAFNDKAKDDDEHFKQHIALLLQLTTIIEDNDSDKLKSFMENIGAPVAVGLFVEYFKMKIGLSK